MDITIGRTVLYTLSADDAVAMNRRRTTGASIAERMGERPIPLWPAGAQAHIGNEVHEGDVVPMVVVRIWSPTTVNGQAFLDGNDVLWVTSATEGTGPHTWQWPPRA